MTHIDHLLTHVPDLKERKILDLGAGTGDFLIDAARRGFSAEGIEVNPAYIKRAHERARSAGVVISIHEGPGEKLSFDDTSFDFVNAAEVLEHVHDHKKVLSEVSRVLRPSGIAYLSIPNRFGVHDPHYHVFFVNWLPRFLSEAYLSLFAKKKDYSKTVAGYQKLSDMHYMTRGQFEKLCRKHNLRFVDSREKRVREKFGPLGLFFGPLYRLYAFFFISTYHGLAYKESRV